ncbi:c-type cytochrome [Neolewinella aurantiaca]|uniref:C-type cytochrome n=1 Tax=Neolewinella aurantiaca TaxID=2602767 RepID=A0A5C7FA10_9BACT|nr:cytochrome c peroxidase [Neolewinella aurantiaca]TXF87611.1 c-type cytochrome [Neolewinella aurantiaca]
MNKLLTLITLGGIGLSLTSCLEENITVVSPDVDGYSNPQSLEFNESEYATLSQTLDIDRVITMSSVNVPLHIGMTSGLSTVDQTSSDARKALLGRVLFHDSRLSATGETTCESCHKQAAAFSDDVAFSRGINGAVTKRNSIALGSVPTFAPVISGYGSSGDEQTASVDGDVKFFWDERANTIKEQSEATIQDELEMGKDLHELSSELKNLEMYKILSMKAFGTTDLTPDRITLALEKFTSSIVSMNTRFDEMRDQELFGGPSTVFSPEERLGAQLFRQNCSTCHGDEMGKPRINVASNGLDEVYTDKGVGALSGNLRESGVFKVPFLRNVALTGPYMHDGRFETLREVIDHYSEGIQDHINLHPFLKENNRPRRMNFTENEKDALIAFLNMATDHTVLTDPKLSDPFRQ